MYNVKDLSQGTFSIKEIPDIYYCDENGKVLYYSNLLNICRFKRLEEKWLLYTSSPMGNAKVWFDIQNDIIEKKIDKIFLRTNQLNSYINRIEPLCLMLKPTAIFCSDFNFTPKENNESCDFPIAFFFEDMYLINEMYAPNYGKDEKGNFVIDANLAGIKIDRAYEMRNYVRKEDASKREVRYL